MNKTDFTGNIKVNDQFFILEDNAKFEKKNGKLVLLNDPTVVEELVSYEADNPYCEDCENDCKSCPWIDEISVSIVSGKETTSLTEMIRAEFLILAEELRA